MRCPTLKELPPPSKHRVGWPWTEESLQLPDTMPDGSPWPKISIVTPNYNYGRFIEETIRSVLLQGYPNLEYIIIDNRSTDNSIKIIKKYEKWLTYWVSEEDKGAAQAINKGFGKSTGELLAWINSDDTYEKNAFYQIVKEFIAHPEVDIISGICRLWSGKQNDVMVGPSPLRSYEDFLLIDTNLMNYRTIMQPEAFFRRRAYDLSKGVPENLYYVFDFGLWINMARKGCIFYSIAKHLANLRLYRKQHSTDRFALWIEICSTAWYYLRQDWDMFEKRTPFIADDIFSAAKKMQTLLKRDFDKIRNSTSYRLGRWITRFRFW